MTKGYIKVLLTAPYTSRADKKLIEQSLKTLVDSIDGAKCQAVGEHLDIRRGRVEGV